MNPEDQVADLFAKANPVPDPRALEDDAEPQREMAGAGVRETPVVATAQPVRSRSRNGRIAAAAAVVVAAATSVWLLTIEPGPGAGGDVADQVDASPLQVVRDAFRTYESGDIEAWQAMWAPDATWEQTTSTGITYSGMYFGSDGVFDYGRRNPASDWDADGEVTIADIESRSLAEFYASSGQWRTDCEPAGSITVTCRVTPTTAFGAWFFTNTQLAGQKGGDTTGTVTVTITDGLITRFATELDLLDRTVVIAYQEAQRDYWTWVRDNHPDLADQLVGTSIGQLLFTPDNYRQHRQLIDEWSVRS